jgi:hypothetical protein
VYDESLLNGLTIIRPEANEGNTTIVKKVTRKNHGHVSGWQLANVMAVGFSSLLLLF